MDTTGGTPSIAIANDQAGGGSAASLTAAYQSGNRTNRLRFRVTLGAAGTTVVADDVLSVAAQNIALNSGTLVDTADGSTAALVAISAAAASAAGTLTATA